MRPPPPGRRRAASVSPCSSSCARSSVSSGAGGAGATDGRAVGAPPRCSPVVSPQRRRRDEALLEGGPPRVTPADGESAYRRGSVPGRSRGVAIHLRGLPGDIGRAARPALGLAPGGVCRAARVAPGAGAPLPHRFTLACARSRGPSAVCSLLHCPAGHPDWPLASTLPCGAPTFLDPPRRTARRTATTRPTRRHGESPTHAGSRASGGRPGSLHAWPEVVRPRSSGSTSGCRRSTRRGRVPGRRGVQGAPRHDRRSRRARQATAAHRRTAWTRARRGVRCSGASRRSRRSRTRDA